MNCWKKYYRGFQ
ncbi:hypothetical protein CFP56_009507 [Quercus suber]|uniref:Uncharacterized protein n=1 Tax=Quercus suber TaxID=58331 RepID=A0AAW0M4J8_QUESU